MRRSDIKTKLKVLDNLTDPEFWMFRERMGVLDQRKIVTLILEEDNEVQCGHCGSSKYVKHGRRYDLQRYKCRQCEKTFNKLTGTPLAGLRMKGRWLDYANCLSEGSSVRQAAKETGVSKNTSFKWRHLFLLNANNLKAEVYHGVVELEETKFKYSEKGANVIGHPELLGTDVYVLSSVDRNRMVSTPKIWELETNTIEMYHRKSYSKDALLLLENNAVLDEFINFKGLNSKTVYPDSKRRYKHLQNVRNYNSELHDWMCRFKGVATKYLQNYLSWFRELDEYYMDIPKEILLVRAISETRFPYQPKVKTE